jgi:outer membrane protein assembly factor BamB
VASVPALPPISSDADAAAQFHVDAAHSGDQPGDALRPPLREAWSRSLPGVQYPLVASGRVFVASSYVDSSTDQHLADMYALDARDGSVIWGPVRVSSRVDPQGWGYANYSYDNGKVFVANPDQVLAIDAGTGRTMWSAPVTSVDGVPTAVNGTIYLVNDDNNGTLYALSEATGKVLWWSGQYYQDLRSAPSYYRGRVYLGSGEGQVQAYDAATGDLAWESDYDTYGGAGTVVVSLHRSVAYGYDWWQWQQQPTGGDVEPPAAWQSSTGSLLTKMPYFFGPGAYAGDHGYFAAPNSPSGSDTIWSRRLSSGQTQWSFTVPRPANSDTMFTDTSEPVTAGGYVYFTDYAGDVFALDGSTGNVVWQGAAGGPIESTRGIGEGLTIGDGLLLVPAGDRLTAFTSVMPASLVDRAWWLRDGPDGWLADPLDQEHTAATQRVRDYAHGSIFATAQYGAHALPTVLAHRYEQLGGAASALGRLTGNGYTRQLASLRLNIAAFAHGQLLAVSGHGTHPVTGIMYQFWRAHRGIHGAFGPPIGNAWSRNNIVRQRFLHGGIACTPQRCYRYV